MKQILIITSILGITIGQCFSASATMTPQIETKSDSSSLKSKSELVVQPNPMANRTTFVFGRNRSSSKLLLIDPMGRLVRKVDRIQGDQFILKRKGLSAGIYSYYIEHANGDLDRGKLVLE